MFQGYNQPESSLLAFQEQILGMGTGDYASKFSRFFYREQWRVIYGFGFNAQFFKSLEQYVARCRCFLHGL